MNISFEEWESLYEGNFLDKVKNLLSKSFGGAVSRLDELVESYRKSEKDYIEDWDNGSIEKDKLEIELSQVKSDPAEAKKVERMIKRNRDVFRTADKARSDRAEAIDKKARSIIRDNGRLRTYWEVEISRINAEISEILHKKAKSLSNPEEADRLYGIYQKALLDSKKKEEDFKTKFGTSFLEKIPVKISSETEGDSTITDGSQEIYINLPIKDFTSKMKDLDPKQKRILISRLTKERNERYVSMDMEQDSLIKQMENKNLKGKELEEEKSKIKLAKQKYLEEIRDLRSKITIARRNV